LQELAEEINNFVLLLQAFVYVHMFRVHVLNNGVIMTIFIF